MNDERTATHDILGSNETARQTAKPFSFLPFLDRVDFFLCLDFRGFVLFDFASLISHSQDHTRVEVCALGKAIYYSNREEIDID